MKRRPAGNVLQMEAFPALERPAEIVRIVQQESLAHLRTLPSDSIDSIITDPPYGLSDMTEAEIRRALAAWLWGHPHQAEGAGYMGRGWDGFVPGPELWSEALRVLKPGGYLCSFASTRTQGLMSIALQLAGFQIEDTLAWIHANKMPKGSDIAKQIDKSRGHWRGKSTGVHAASVSIAGPEYKRAAKGRAVSERARQHEGRHTQIKQAYEPIIQAIKPYSGPAYRNVLEHGTGALNVNACLVRVPAGMEQGKTGALTRWPTNVLIERTPEVVAPLRLDGAEIDRFFYAPRVRGEDRIHETQKPLSLMRWLIRLHTPVRGVVLDMFAGSGTTGEAAIDEDRFAILIEQDALKVAGIRARIAQRLA